MKILTMEQGTHEWKMARLGIPTASCFSKLVTPSKLTPSNSSGKYLDQLIAEWVLGYQLDDGDSGFMTRGSEMEKEAIKWYEFHRSVKVQRVGFCLHDNGLCGGSPDGLVGEDGGLEVKCPSAPVHVNYLLGDVSKAHRLQVQGNIWITGRAWWDVLSYNPEMEKALVRAHRDADVMAALDEAVPAFITKLVAAQNRMRELGHIPACERLAAQEQQEQEARHEAAVHFGLEDAEVHG